MLLERSLKCKKAYQIERHCALGVQIAARGKCLRFRDRVETLVEKLSDDLEIAWVG